MSGTNIADNRNNTGKTATIFLNEKYLICFALKESQHLLNRMLLMKSILRFLSRQIDRQNHPRMCIQLAATTVEC